MIIFVVIIIVCLLAIAAFIFFYVRLINKHGLPEPPDEIMQIDQDLNGSLPAFEATGYQFEKELSGRKTYSRCFETKDGVWRLVVETDNDEIIAYQATLDNRKTKLLNTVYEKWKKDPKIIMISGCG